MLLIRLLRYYHDRADLGSTVQEQEIRTFIFLYRQTFLFHRLYGLETEGH